ncbi:MAG: FAD binding domain-containing protein [Gemmobacter sp.]|uniref:FAD binding domain-containing protein n=1 Tax=Gemmobacter sp. TaxID=1898957 RepID=UPI003918E761
MVAWARPASLDQALAALAADPSLRVVAGGTDVYPALAEAAPRTPMLDLSALPLRGIARTRTGWCFGALTTWTDIARARLPAPMRALQQAAVEVGSPQIQNAGTIAGNIVNASPAADGTVALLALDAQVEVAGPAPRRVPLADFVLGPRKVALNPGELVTAVHVPDPGDGAGGFLKLGARRYLVISIAMVAASLRLDRGAIVQAGIAVGACAPVARRLAGLEARLQGVPLAQAAALVRPEDAAGLAPISDVRADAAYRAEAVPVLVARLLERLAREAT